MKRTRYCGEVTIELEYLAAYEHHNKFACRVTVGGHVWEHDNIRTDPWTGVVDNAFDEAAARAIHWGSQYHLGWDLDDGCIPDWAPPRYIAQAINDGLSVDDRGYVIDRTEPAAIPHCG